ncbi:hypothetical protein V8C34DRAFT_286019 [Trichoderma compactum]
MSGKFFFARAWSSFLFFPFFFLGFWTRIWTVISAYEPHVVGGRPGVRVRVRVWVLVRHVIESQRIIMSADVNGRASVNEAVPRWMQSRLPNPWPRIGRLVQR